MKLSYIWFPAEPSVAKSDGDAVLHELCPPTKEFEAPQVISQPKATYWTVVG
jgi:hypothetical protein